MTSSVSWVQTGEGVVLDWVDDAPPLFAQDPPPPTPPWSLQSLTDVAETTAAPAGHILTKSADGQWRPAPPSAASVSHYRHEQLTPASEWTINHNLGRHPAGVVIKDSAGDIVTPSDVAWLNNNTMFLSFSDRQISGNVTVT